MKALILVMIIGLGFQALAGQDGGGGDAVYCTADGGAFNYDGVYLLDYVMKQDGEGWAYEKDQLDHLKFISERLKLIGEYNEGFVNRNVETFIHEFERKLNGVLNVWIPADLPLRDIKDENIPKGFQFPQNCKLDKVYQVVTKVNITRFFYDINM